MAQTILHRFPHTSEAAISMKQLTRKLEEMSTRAAYFILRGIILSVKPWRLVEKRRAALREADAGDYNF